MTPLKSNKRSAPSTATQARKCNSRGWSPALAGAYTVSRTALADMVAKLGDSLTAGGAYGMSSGAVLVDANGALTKEGRRAFEAWRVAWGKYLGNTMYPNARQGRIDASTNLGTRLADAFFEQYYAREGKDFRRGHLGGLVRQWSAVAASMQFHVATTSSLFEVVATKRPPKSAFTYARIKWIPTHSGDIPVEFIVRFRTDADLDAAGFHVYAKWDTIDPNNKRWVGNLIGASGNALPVEVAWSSIVSGDDVLLQIVNGMSTYKTFGGKTQLVLADLADPPDPLPAGYLW